MVKLLRYDGAVRPCLKLKGYCMCAVLPQVRSDCPPRQLVDFLLSDSGVQADQVRGRQMGGMA